MNKALKKLPVVVDCNGCGVCCFHMGYPPFIKPQPPITAGELQNELTLAGKTRTDPLLKQTELRGRAGERWWHELPSDLKEDLEAFVTNYTVPNYGSDVESFDGPCYWFDMNSRRCKHHEHRPQVCRDFETGSTDCLEWRKYYAGRIEDRKPSSESI
jgi:Fe-S-cluster containining protein